MTRKIAMIATFALLGIIPALAQDARGRVRGTVTDGSGASITKATVILTNSETRISAQQETSPSGQYIFDFVLPGTYTVQVELSGFKKFLQKNLLVQTRADVTMNATLEIGSVREQITVEAAPVAVQFTTSTMGLTVDMKMTNNLPIIHRNPFLLAALNPAVVVRSSNEQSPYHHWAASQLDVGGNTTTKNDIILDGSPSMTTQKSSYTPPMDAVQEVNLQQNAVDSEFGHSAGGVLSLSMKSGTNAYHGTALYQGRNPALNALADRTTNPPAKSLTRQNVWSMTLGNAIKKNKIFNFAAYEGQRTIEPRVALNTLPTSLERTGDFSKSLNRLGQLRTIYDPYSTQVTSSAVTRVPFAGNVIPASRIDPVGKNFMQDIWQPSVAGAALNNFNVGYANRFKYWNFSDRVDYNVNDKLKIFGRFNTFRTYSKWDDYSGGSVAVPVDGSKRHARTFSGDAVYTLNSTTVFNVRGAFNSIVDSFGVPEATLTPAALGKIFNGNSWFAPYLAQLPDIYYPGVTVNTAASSGSFGKGGYWYQEPKSWNIQSKISKSMGRHYWKAGGEFRQEIVTASRPRPMTLNFSPTQTANTFQTPDTTLSGDGYASLLLGTMSGGAISSIPIQRPKVNFFGLFFQDDFKITSKLVLNLGLRYEFFTAMKDPDYRLSRYLDLTNPIPELQGVKLPADATALRTAPPVFSGAWVFTDKNTPGSWNAPKGLFMPRLGLAWRINDKTSLRVGFARYIVPATLSDGLNILGSVPYPGFDATSNVIGDIQGVPQQRVSDPFPGGLVPVRGKEFGRYTQLGGGTTWYQQDFHPGVNDRINISLQRQLPGRILADFTYFMNIGRSSPYSYDLNQVDPRIGYNLMSQLNNVSAVSNIIGKSVANPFFNLLPLAQMPGQLRTQANVPVSDLLRPYPQYQGSLNETLRGGLGNRYKSVQMQFQRPFANGFNLVMGYNWNRETNQEFYDSQDFYTKTLTWQPARNAAQRITGAAIYELPFGKGRRFASNMHPAVDGVFGGWSISSLATYNTGVPLRWGGLLVDGDPTLSSPSQTQWFDTSKIKILPNFTRRTNPLQYAGLNGPRFWNVDSTIAKEFKIIPERLRFELRAEAYNLTNRFPANDPDSGVNSRTFGKIISQRSGVYGRQIQFQGKFIF